MAGMARAPFPFHQAGGLEMMDNKPTGPDAAPAPAAARPDLGEGLVRPEDLRQITSEAEQARVHKLLELEKKREGERKELQNAFLNQHIRPDARERFITRVREAAQRGEHEIEIVRFSSEFCTDGGRRINNFDPEWPDSLTGFAREVYEAYDQHLRKLGYKLRAQILNYPGGMPGEVGIFLSW
jgi:hypothetical protein